MNMESKFVSYSLRSARNGEHYEYINHLLGIFTEANAESLGIQIYRSNLATLFNKEDEAIKQIMSYENTQSVIDYDARRDDLFRYLTQEVKNQQRSPIASRKAAATRLAPLMKTYAGAADKTQRDETGLLRNLIADLEKALYANDVAALGLTEVVTALKEANDAFDGAFYQRIDEKDYRRATANMKTVRPEVDKAYQDLITMLNSLYNVYSLTPSAFTTQLALLDSLAAPLNAGANDMKQSIITRTGSGTLKPGGGGGTTPDDRPDNPDSGGDDDKPDSI